jgi:RNA polymerase sigma-70 factor (family 1)
MGTVSQRRSEKTLRLSAANFFIFGRRPSGCRKTAANVESTPGIPENGATPHPATDPAYDEREVLVRVARGDQHAFRQLFDRHRDKIYSFALYLTRLEPTAEEITQDVFTKAWTHREKLPKLDYFPSWLKVVARNEAYNYLKRKARERLALLDLAGQGPVAAPSSEGELEARDFARLLREAVDRLPPQQQRVYLLSRREGLKQEEIAAELQLSVRTVKNHMSAALRSVRDYVDTRIDVAVLIAIALFFSE